VPKYLVDDRDGVWTIKGSLIEEAKGGAPRAPDAPQKLSASNKPDEIMDSWEDIDSPQQSPAAATLNPEALELSAPEAKNWDADADAAATVDDDADGPMTRAKELRAERMRLDDDDEELLPSAGPSKSPDIRPKTPPLRASPAMSPIGTPSRAARIGKEDVDDDIRCCGTPNLGPRSPSQRLALAKLGLLDDLDNEDKEPPR